VDIINEIMKSSSILILSGGLIAAVGGALVAWGTFIAGKESEKQQFELQSKSEKSIELGNKSIELANGIESLNKEIKLLQNLNNKIVSSTHLLTTENLLTSKKTKLVADDIDKLTTKVNALVRQVNDEITGGSSVPVVQADIGLYLPWSSTSYREPEPLEFSGKWRIDFRIQNFGEFPLANIRMSQQTSRRREQSEEKELDNIGTIRAGEIKSLNFIQGVWPTVSDPITYNIKVKWKIEYTYSVTFSENETFGPEGKSKQTYFKSDQYSYKGKVYQSIPEFVRAVRADLQQ
jgi:hypothetical protein